jgi:hypothetical protein
MPKTMLKHLVLLSCYQLNIFPAKTGVSAYFSPYMLMLGRNIEYGTMRIPFGSYVQASHEATDYNTLQPRTIGCIHLGRAPSKQAGHILLHLNTGELITRPRATIIPMTDDVISRVEALATADGIKGLKLADRNGIVFDQANLEGVDVAVSTDTDDVDDGEEDDDEYDPDDSDDSDDDDTEYDDMASKKRIFSNCGIWINNKCTLDRNLIAIYINTTTLLAILSI